MQAVRNLRTLLGTLAAAALGLLLAWLVFSGWIGITGRATTAHRRPTTNSSDTESHEPKSASHNPDESAAEPPILANVNARPISVESDIVLASEEHAAAVAASPIDVTAPELTSGRETESEALTRLLDLADHHFARGNLSECVQRYQFLLPNTHGLQRRLVAIKLGIAAENLSDLDTAARAYSASLELHPQDDLASLALFRIAAILATQGDFVGARAHLCDWWLSGGMQSGSEFEHSAVHLLAEIQGRIACGSSPEDFVVGLHYLADDRVAWPFRHDPPLIELSDLEDVLDLQPEPPVHQPSRIDIIDQFSSSAEDTFASVQVTGRPLAGVCDALLRKAGFTLSWSEAGYRRASERSITLSLSDVNMAVMLDLMTRGSGLIWLQTNDGLVIAAENDLNPEDLVLLDSAAARRLAQFAITTYPANKRQRLTELSLANLDFHEGQLTDASHRYAQLLEKSAERLWATEASFNLGKVRFLLGDLEGAAQAFLRSSDGALGHPLQPAALLYAGRLHVLLNRMNEAVPLFSRAWTMSRGGALEPESLICLSAVYAYLGNPVGANRILVDHREVVSNVSHYHDTAAFLGCYCRFQLARTDTRKLRDARDLLDALGNVEPHTFFAPHGWAIVMRAYHQLGLDQESRTTLQECLLVVEDSPFRDELVRGEAYGLSQQEGIALPRSTSDFEQLSAMVGDEVLHRFERVKTLLGEGNHGELVQEARLLLQEELPSPMQIELLDMLGRSYQREADHYNAALCFARINPFSERADRLRGEFFRQRVMEWGATQP